MTPEQIEQVRPRLVEFTVEMLDGAVRRSDQRAKGELYLRGLLTDGARNARPGGPESANSVTETCNETDTLQRCSRCASGATHPCVTCPTPAVPAATATPAAASPRTATANSPTSTTNHGNDAHSPKAGDHQPPNPNRPPNHDLTKYY